MKFLSTRGGGEPVGFRGALFRGLAEDGGLFVPERIPVFSPEVLEELRARSFPSVARTVLMHLLQGEIPPERVAMAVDSAFDFMVPFVHLPGDLQLLELFHGPTLAFKDFGARLMARLVQGFLAEGGREQVTILTATSGDTGGAVANAFFGMKGVRVVVLFPLGRISPQQEHQFTTLGENVEAVGVEGTFDDCQRLVKDAFEDVGLVDSVGLTSANSINVGRLLPQVLFYFFAWAHQAEGREPVFVVPSGNLGNLTAGILAWRMGLPARGFVGAANANKVLPDFLDTGRFEPRPSIRTISSAMDVGSPSNLERLSFLFEGARAPISEIILGTSHQDEETLYAIHESFDRLEYIPDPHTAVGLLAAAAARDRWPGSPRVVLATAHPAKFPEAITQAIGQPPALPPALARPLERESRFQTIGPDQEALRTILKA